MRLISAQIRNVFHETQYSHTDSFSETLLYWLIEFELVTSLDPFSSS